jgi:hypothetical protein
MEWPRSRYRGLTLSCMAVSTISMAVCAWFAWASGNSRSAALFVGLTALTTASGVFIWYKGK